MFVVFPDMIVNVGDSRVCFLDGLILGLRRTESSKPIGDQHGQNEKGKSQAALFVRLWKFPVHCG